VNHRRYFHVHAEVGLNLPKTRAYVMQTLRSYGLEPKACGSGVTATIGKGGRTILLRADMDALPIREESGEPFACTTGNAHACGHDFHAAMLLTAAKLLKEREDQLAGTVKLMFQPGEEVLLGARDMMENGLLDDPMPDAALAVHVCAGKEPPGMYMYNDTGALMASVDGFRITIRGKGAHGAYPQAAIDPINIAVHVYLAMEDLISREAEPEKMCILSVGKFTAGSAWNVIPESAVLEGAVRTNDKASRERLLRRLHEVAEKTAEVYDGTAQVEMLCQVPPLTCDPGLMEEIVGYLEQSGIPQLRSQPGITANASEDFALIAERIPSAYLYLSAGFPDERGELLAHNPQVVFDEDVCPIGAACLVHCAESWLKAHKM